MQPLLISASTMLIADASWIGANRHRYRAWLEPIDRVFVRHVDVLAAAASYVVLFVVGFAWLAVPAMNAFGRGGNRWWVAFRWSGLLGLVAYATFNLVNKALFASRYSWTMAIVDTAWGAVLFTIMGYAYLAASQLSSQSAAQYS